MYPTNEYGIFLCLNSNLFLHLFWIKNLMSLSGYTPNSIMIYASSLASEKSPLGICLGFIAYSCKTWDPCLWNLVKALNRSMFPLPYKRKKIRIMITQFIILLWRLDEIICTKHLESAWNIASNLWILLLL